MTVKINARVVNVLLAQRDLDQKQLSELSGVSEQTIVRLLKGLPFTSETLGKIAGALDVNPIDLIDAEGYADPLVVASAASVA